MARVLQCVASRGLVSSVSVTTSSTCASLTVRGAPGRGSSSSPSSRLARNRLRHFPTVCFVSRSFRATRVFVSSAAHPRMTRARCARACAVVGRRVQRCNISRSGSVNVKGGIGRPMRMSVLLSTGGTLSTHTLFHVFQTHDTSQSFDNTIRRSRQALAIQRFQLIANAVEQLVEAFDQLLLPLRELVF